MRAETVGKLLLGALTAGLWLPGAQAKTCLLVYQLADNNLQYYLQQDFEELTSSQAIQSPDISVFVYYDGSDGTALPGVYNSAGSLDTSDFSGSRYLHWDQSAGRMVVVEQLSGEQNSELPGTVQAFLEYGMTSCVSTGHTSFMAVFSDHGGGFAGYGEDDHQSRHFRRGLRHRGLMMTNDIVAGAIRGALDNTSGAPSKLSVLGFDACLMSALDAADDYKDVADYMLASEAVEPGHGWAFAYLTQTSDALSLAKEVVNTFIDQTQGGTTHQVPKTLAVVDTSLYMTMVEKLELFLGEALSVIQAGDGPVFTYISRARSNAVAFEGIVDSVGTKYGSAVDLGSVLYQIKDMCNPGGNLGTYLDDARAAYDAMYVIARMGEGTSPGTGMSITWPDQNSFRANAVWNQVLFGAPQYQTAIAPNLRAFLDYFLNNDAPSDTGGATICGKGIAAPASSTSTTTSTEPTLLQDTNADIQDEVVVVTATMDPSVDQVVVEYAVDLSTPLKEVMTTKGQLPQDGDYLFLLGGDVKGNYDGSSYSATWNKHFYFLDVFGRGTYEALYTFDQGNGAKSVPCLYFTEASRQAVTINKEIQWLEYLFFNETHFLELGASYCFLTFSVNNDTGVVDNNLILFTSDGGSNTFAEKRREDKGFIYPMVYVDAIAKGYKLSALPGGFNQTYIDWDESLDYQVISTAASEIFDTIPDTDAVVLNMYGHNFDLSAGLPTDPYHFDIIRPEKSGPKLTSTDTAATSGGVSGFRLVGVAVGAMATVVLCGFV